MAVAASSLRRCAPQWLVCAFLTLFISACPPLIAQTSKPAVVAETAAIGPSVLPEAPQPAAKPAEIPLLSTDLNSSPQQSGNTVPPPDTGLSLGDLGLTPQQTQGDEQQQERLNRHTQMLRMHQRWGLITTIPIAAACISSVGAPPEHGNYGNTTSRDVHVALGGTAVVMYGITASYAIRAPKVSDEPARGGIKLHKYLIYIHAPGMILTPILGAMAFNQINSGQKVHGIASAHSGVAVATAASYGAAILAVTWPIHIKSFEF